MIIDLNLFQIFEDSGRPQFGHLELNIPQVMVLLTLAFITYYISYTLSGARMINVIKIIKTLSILREGR